MLWKSAIAHYAVNGSENISFMNDITLWFGDVGTRLDGYGNVYPVSKPVAFCGGSDRVEADLVSMYQAILRECGFAIRVVDVETPYDRRVHRVTHTIIHDGGMLPRFARTIGYEYKEGEQRK